VCGAAEGRELTQCECRAQVFGFTAVGCLSCVSAPEIEQHFPSFPAATRNYILRCCQSAGAAGGQAGPVLLAPSSSPGTKWPSAGVGGVAAGSKRKATVRVAKTTAGGKGKAAAGDDDDSDFADGSRKRKGKTSGPAAGEELLDEPPVEPTAPRKPTPYQVKVFFGSEDQPSAAACFPITVRIMDLEIGKYTEAYSKSDVQRVKEQWASYFVEKGIGKHAAGHVKAPVELRAIDAALPWCEFNILCQVALLRVTRAMRRWEDRADTTGGMPARLVDKLTLLD